MRSSCGPEPTRNAQCPRLNAQCTTRVDRRAAAAPAGSPGEHAVDGRSGQLACVGVDHGADAAVRRRRSATTTSSPPTRSSRSTGRRSTRESDRMQLVDIGRTEEGRDAVDGGDLGAREPGAARSLPGHLPPARARRGAERRAGARARGGGQGGRLDRRRPARQRGARRAAADRNWSISWSADPTPRRCASCATSSSWRCTPTPTGTSWWRTGTCASVIRCGGRSPVCRARIRSTSATTTTATSTCRVRPRRST